ncbi:MAG: hypothetical protein AAF823_10695 [Planctomycetota bacterium]
MSWLAAALWLACVWCGVTPTHASEATAQERLDEASELVVRFEFDAARTAYAALVSELAPDDPLRRQAMFGQAVAAQHQQPPDPALISEAERLFNELANDGTGDALAARSLLNTGRILEIRDYRNDPERPNDAIPVYRRVIADYPDLPIAHEAALRIGGAYLQQFADPAAVAEGVAFLESHLSQHPDNPFAGAMHLLLYDHYRPRDAADDALRHLVAGDAVGLPVSRVGEYYWQAGEIASSLPGRLDTAVEFYTKTVVETPSSGRAYQALDRLRALAAEHPDANIELPEFRFGRSAITTAQ